MTQVDENVQFACNDLHEYGKALALPWIHHTGRPPGGDLVMRAVINHWCNFTDNHKFSAKLFQTHGFGYG